MASTVFRSAADLCDGDEIILEQDVGGDPIRTGIIAECSTDEFDMVTLVLKIDPTVEIATVARPREEITPFETAPAECGPADG
jgi:hypothetical protein